MPFPACHKVWQYQAVFTGVVTHIVDPGFPTVRPGEPPPTSDRYPRKQVTVKISAAFTGLEPATKEITIETGLGGGDCGYAFERGVEYIIYAHQGRGGSLVTGICSPTRPIAAAEEDLQYLRKLPDPPNAGEIRVTTADLSRRRDAGASRASDLVRLAGAKVSLEGQNVRRTADTDNNGRHVFSGLPPGEYQISVGLDGFNLSSGQPNPLLSSPAQVLPRFSLFFPVKSIRPMGRLVKNLTIGAKVEAYDERDLAPPPTAKEA